MQRAVGGVLAGNTREGNRGDVGKNTHLKEQWKSHRGGSVCLSTQLHTTTGERGAPYVSVIRSETKGNGEIRRALSGLTMNRGVCSTSLTNRDRPLALSVYDTL